MGTKKLIVSECVRESGREDFFLLLAFLIKEWRVNEIERKRERRAFWAWHSLDHQNHSSKRDFSFIVFLFCFLFSLERERAGRGKERGKAKREKKERWGKEKERKRERERKREERREERIVFEREISIIKTIYFI